MLVFALHFDQRPFGYLKHLLYKCPLLTLAQLTVCCVEGFGEETWQHKLGQGRHASGI